jgi:GNAT superfamily N-acetyltransferase
VKALRQLLEWVLRYEAYRVYGKDTKDIYVVATEDTPVVVSKRSGLEIDETSSPSAFDNAPDAGVQELAEYAGKDMIGLRAKLNGEVVGGCWFLFGDRYRTERGFVILANDEAMLEQVTVAEKYGEQGIAQALLETAVKTAAARGFRRVLCRILHSHTALIRAFEKDGWTYQYTAVVARPFGLPWPIRFKLVLP